MTSFIITALSVVTLVGFAALARALKHAPEGYEDGAGFHHGIMPSPHAIADHISPRKLAAKRAA
jgi:hypothetical protein